MKWGNSDKKRFTREDIPDLSGRTALVTGGTKGIGYETVRALALAHARVLILARSTELGQKAVTTIKQESSSADVEFIQCDLADLAMVKQVADKICKDEARMDIVIANAAIGLLPFGLTKDGIDRHFAINHLGHYLLINRLLPLLRRTARLSPAPSPGPRIVTLTSNVHRSAPASTAFAAPAEVCADAGLSAMALYARSKLAVALFAKFGLAERVFTQPRDRDRGISAVTLHPGIVHTDQLDQLKDAYGLVVGSVLKYLTLPLAQRPAQGCLSVVWAATAAEVDRNGWSGRYLDGVGQLAEPSKLAQDPELGRNLWVLSEQLVKEKLGPDALLPWDVGSE
ncbi:NAD-binding protein [Cubamyces sp. BRFM 1775]|nr:NAD-binding protein [Cubamyces sp. BRFM 1775]